MPADLPPLHAAEAKAAMMRAYRPEDRPEGFRNCRHPSTKRYPFGAPHRVRCTADWVSTAEISDELGPLPGVIEIEIPLPLVAVRRPNGKVEVIEPW